MRVAIVHDYLTQRGGAERVALEMLRTFPDAPLLTAVYEPSATFPEFADFHVDTTWLDRVPSFRADPRRALPVLSQTFSSFRLTGIDAVLCSSSGWAHGVRTDARKVVYCHNPARWLYQMPHYAPDLGRGARLAVRALAPALRRWDRHAAASADLYLANSTDVATRVRAEYGLRAQVLHPPRGLQPEGPQTPVEGLAPGFLLSVGRTRAYKNMSQLAPALELLPEERLVIVGGHDEWAGPRVRCLNGISDAQLRWLYANAAALVAISHEDFGLTPVEAFAFGIPVLALGAGGYLDSMRPGVTGLLFDDLTPAGIARAVRELRSRQWDPVAIRRHGEVFSPGAFATKLRGAVARVVGGTDIDLRESDGDLARAGRR